MLKAVTLIYTIRSIVNGRLSSENITESISSVTPLQKRVKWNMSKDAVTVAHRRDKILVIGDSHVRGLSYKVNTGLSDAFCVKGFTKPNANIEGIISSLYTSFDDLTKKDIGKNDSSKGLHLLKAFAQRTANTNVILLGAPRRYEMSLSSCVNTEVKLFNKRLQSVMLVFNRVSFISACIERIYHTNHGLHSNQEGRDCRLLGCYAVWLL
jgi:hypothetical protein